MVDPKSSDIVLIRDRKEHKETQRKWCYVDGSRDWTD